MPPSDGGASTEALLREAQHRVLNDLQTVFSIVRLAQSRQGSDFLRTDDLILWMNCLACVYDALPIWDQDRRIVLRSLVSVLRERVQAPRIDAIDDDESSVPGASGVAVALAMSSLLEYALVHASGPARLDIHTQDGTVRVSVSFEDDGRAPAGWTSLSGRVAADALSATYDWRRQETRAVMDLVIPCR